jgi:Methyltransferase domain
VENDQTPSAGRFLDSRDDPDGQARLAREAPILLHSLREFAPLIEPLLAAVGPERVIEIGGETGQASVAYLEAGAGEVVCVDPAPGDELLERARNEDRLKLVRERSPDCIPSLPRSNFWAIDGDHNYVTVRAELEAVLARAGSDGEQLILFHDVLWPLARRDMYYDPGALDPTSVHPHSWEAGPSVFSESLTPSGFVGAGQYAIAVESGGERNGVRTAIEDVLEGHPQLAFAVVPAVFGLGVVYDRGAPWAGQVAELLEPWDRSPLLTRLELNRIALYSRVLELQYELAQRAGG